MNSFVRRRRGWRRTSECRDGQPGGKKLGVVGEQGKGVNRISERREEVNQLESVNDVYDGLKKTEVS